MLRRHLDEAGLAGVDGHPEGRQPLELPRVVCHEGQWLAPRARNPRRSVDRAGALDETEMCKHEGHSTVVPRVVREAERAVGVDGVKAALAALRRRHPQALRQWLLQSVRCNLRHEADAPALLRKENQDADDARVV